MGDRDRRMSARASWSLATSSSTDRIVSVRTAHDGVSGVAFLCDRPVGRGARTTSSDRLWEVLGVRQDDSWVLGVPEPGDPGTDHGPVRSAVLVELDRVEAVRERGDDVRHEQDVGVRQVCGDVSVASRGPRSRTPASSRRRRSAALSGAGPTRTSWPRPARRARRASAEVEVDPVTVDGADVERDGSVGQVGGPRAGSPVGVHVHRVRDEGERDGRHGRPSSRPSSAGEQTTTWSRVPQQPGLVGDQALVLASGVAGVQPVVGDVVERAPAGAGEQSGRRRVVDPEQRVVEARADRPLGRPGRPAAASACGSTRRGSALVPWYRCSRPGSTPSRAGTGAQSGPAARPRPAADGVDGVRGRLDEQHPERRVVAQQPRDEVLVAAPDGVPGLEGGHDEVPGHSTPRYTSSVARCWASSVNRDRCRSRWATASRRRRSGSSASRRSTAAGRLDVPGWEQRRRVEEAQASPGDRRPAWRRRAAPQAMASSTLSP